MCDLYLNRSQLYILQNPLEVTVRSYDNPEVRLRFFFANFMGGLGWLGLRYSVKKAAESLVMIMIRFLQFSQVLFNFNC